VAEENVLLLLAQLDRRGAEEEGNQDVKGLKRGEEKGESGFLRRFGGGKKKKFDSSGTRTLIHVDVRGGPEGKKHTQKTELLVS